jgi:two-component system OmpR family response regulator
VSQTLSILYLDDSPTALREVESTLVALGHTVRTTSAVAEAKRMMAGCELVIIDFHMPGIDGAQARVELQAALQGSARPTYYLYTSDTAVAGRYKELGFDGALTWKGNLEALGPQVQSIARIVRMRKFLAKQR